MLLTPINPSDLLKVRGLYGKMASYPATPGFEGVGVIEESKAPFSKLFRGIGPGRKRALLKHFGSAKAVSRAGVDDLVAVDGISAQMAQTIYDFFHERHG